MRHRSIEAAALTALVTVIAVLAAPALAAAQSCLGLPTRDGQIAVAGAGGRVEDVTELGAEFTIDVTGPATFAFGYAGATSDSDRQTFFGRASYDFFLLEPAICGVAGFFYQGDVGPAVDHRLGIPVGLGMGKTLRGDRFSTTVYVLPQYVWLREARHGTIPTGTTTATSNEFMAEAGLTLGLAPFYVGGAVTVSTIDGNDVGFRLRAGLLF